jgi:glycosyltransferase involved in cell wall biosynthesis
LAYLDHFGAISRGVVQWRGRTTVFDHSVSQQLFDLLRRQGEVTRSAMFALLLTAFRGRIRRRDLAGLFYLNVGHTGLNKPNHGAWISRTGVRPVYFLHDLIPLTHPEYCRHAESERHLRRMVAMLHNAVGVISNSRDTLNELEVFASLRSGLRTPPTLVAPLGVGIAPLRAADIFPSPLPSRPYFVLLGTIEGRKNHLLILNIWAEFARRLGPATPQLIIIGQRGWESEQAVDMLERSEAIRGHVIELPRCDDVMLDAYLRGARALLFPSFVEGYGLPLVEALACGTPVIASDLGVFRELAGDIPDYLSPIDGLGWARAIEDYAHDASAARAAQLERMQSWTAPSWEAHFAKVEDFLEGLAATPPR